MNCQKCGHSTKKHREFTTTNQKGEPYPTKIRCMYVVRHLGFFDITCTCSRVKKEIKA